jgi:hypothetical protein
MKRSQILAAALATVMVGCSNQEPAAQTGAAAQDGLTLTTTSTTRVAGSYTDEAGRTLRFDTARVGDDLFLDLTTGGGKQLIHIETVGDSYQFSYMGGKLTMNTTKQFVAAQRATAQNAPDAVSTDGFQFQGDTSALDEMMQIPEVAALPHLSRALGARGYTGNTFPASLALHKIARQSAEGLGIQVEPVAPAASAEGYCQAYPNQGDDCYGMCGSGCSCWSWVCGDCCYHYGCAVHDSWCRNGQWYYCYNVTAVIALFGC